MNRSACVRFSGRFLDSRLRGNHKWGRRAGAGKSKRLIIRILCIGDVVGKPGRAIVASALPVLVKEREIDCVIANVENAANGSGLTEALYSKFVHYGVDLMTLGKPVTNARSTRSFRRPKTPS